MKMSKLGKYKCQNEMLVFCVQFKNLILLAVNVVYILKTVNLR